ncbi:hypothetical protein ScPMuIL_000516 [Solemya velum]
MVAKRRRYTRKAEAAHRNGHYTSPGSTQDRRSVCGNRTASFWHVRRRLNFGRTPPKVRKSDSMASNHRVRFDLRPKYRTRPSPSKQIVGILRTTATQSQASGRVVKPTRQKVGAPRQQKRRTESRRSTTNTVNKFHREIVQLTEGTCNMLSCRLRSERRETWRPSPHASPEDTNLTREP